MERIKVNLPGTFSFSTILPIRITDLNYGGHVGNDSFLSLIHEARQQFLLSHGFTELKFDSVGLIMADAAIEYKAELNHGDQIRISVAASGFDKLGFDLFYKLEIIKENAEPILAGKAKTGMICYDYTAKKKMPVPEAARMNLSEPGLG
ncbi:MAG: thioesterase [Chitinophagaceae bacterium]|nr:thioesterase [Chitinophagaceae bacterium]